MPRFNITASGEEFENSLTFGTASYGNSIGDQFASKHCPITSLEVIYGIGEDAKEVFYLEPGSKSNTQFQFKVEPAPIDNGLLMKITGRVVDFSDHKEGEVLELDIFSIIPTEHARQICENIRFMLECYERKEAANG